MLIDIKFSEQQLINFTSEFSTKVIGEDDKEIDNPQTREEFAIEKIKNYISNVIESVVVNKVVETTRTEKIAEVKTDLASLEITTK